MKKLMPDAEFYRISLREVVFWKIISNRIANRSPPLLLKSWCHWEMCIFRGIFPLSTELLLLAAWTSIKTSKWKQRTGILLGCPYAKIMQNMTQTKQNCLLRAMKVIQQDFVRAFYCTHWEHLQCGVRPPITAPNRLCLETSKSLSWRNIQNMCKTYAQHAQYAQYARNMQ